MSVRNVSAVARAVPAIDTTATATLPPTAPGGTVLLAIYQRDAPGATYNVPGGFDLLDRSSASSGDNWPISVYEGHPSAGATAFPVTRTDGVGGFAVVAVETEDEVQVDDVLTIGPANSVPTFASVAVAGARLAVGFATVRHDTDVAFTPVASWTEHVDSHLSAPPADNGPQLAVGSREVSAAGTYTFGWSAPSDDMGGVLVILEAAVAPPDDEEPPPYVPPPPARALVELYLPAEGAARWGEALWGVDTWSTSVWTDITPQCVTVDVSWGTTQPDLGVLAPTEAGKWTIVTHDPDRLLDPSNQDSPYYPHVRSLTPIRITTRGYVVRRGHLDFVRHAFASADEVEREWARPAPLRATDNVAILAGAEVPSDSPLADTLWARAADVIAAADVHVPLSVPPRGVDPPLAPWEPGNFRAWAIIAASAQEVGYIAHLQPDGTLNFRPWDDPIDRDSTIGDPELVDLAVETADAGLVSVVIVNDEAMGSIERRITPTPRYGRRVHRRTLATIDGEEYAERVLTDRGAQALRWRMGAVRPLDASAVEWYARREADEIVSLTHDSASPPIEARVRILGARFTIRDLATRPDWRFYFQASTEAAEPLYADGQPSNLLLVSDDDDEDYLYSDGIEIT